MAKIGLVVRPQVRAAKELGKELLTWSSKHGHEVVVESATAKLLKVANGGLERKEVVRLADPIVTLGGDGTLIGVARHVSERAPLLIGVNFGTLGFLTEVAPYELFEVLERVLRGEAKVGER